MNDRRVVHRQEFQGFGIEEPHRHGIALEKQSERFFRFNNLGHILVGPDPADRRATLIQNQFRVVTNPSNRAPRLDNTKPEGNVRLAMKLLRRRLASGSCFHRGDVGMNESEESFRGRGQILIRPKIR
jgi:hypothetical protein